MTVLDEIAATLGAVAPDRAERDLVGLHILDTYGAWIAGEATPDGAALRGLEQAPLPAIGGGVLDRIALVCATVRLTEIDDIHAPSCTTIGSAVVPAALILADALPAPDALSATGDIPAAIAVGYRAMARLGEAIEGATIVYRGVWPSYFCAPFGVAATAARLMGLDAGKTANALAIALTLSTGRAGGLSPVPTARWFQFGQAARAGCVAALAAERGMTADLALLDGSRFSDAFGIALNPEPLGRMSRPVLDEMSFKPWCSAKQSVAATDAFRRILARGVSPGDIQDVLVEVPPPYQPMISRAATPDAGLAALVSAACRIALAAYDPGRLDDVTRSSAPGSEPTNALIAKVSVRVDDTLMAHFPARYPARVTITTQAGQESELAVDTPGDPGTAYGEDEVTAKFQRFTGLDPIPLAKLDDDATLKTLGRKMAGGQTA